MVSKLFVLSIAQLCTKKHQAEDRRLFNVKYEKIKITKIWEHKESTFKKYLKKFRWILLRFVRGLW